MKLIGTSPVYFGKFFNHFKLYWHLCEQREILYSTFDIFIRTEVIHISLEKDWNNNNWNMKELKWICSATNYNNKMLDPNNFLDDPTAYIVHIKNCFYLEHTDL